ncbi:aromatic acid/H+ symport family MFS transporter [Nocardioides cavernae]|uniref:Aromatic acid/H+ symport family MFS transporter n=1 Tax=Nocardioides cavernae TaxID=1921566 RepID=A0ABR8NG70_9ACTN|nr:aromatic acid/H+ symport family MFS transporter [Nocardioides cavernae]MBD3926145.1 aromatic acid/H+ symport family MFS transporter [Nocardioides cavernae]MBM7513736.1 AAHS family benzoate transporter-like MFS transporter [Nocardioides cavernae]
MVTTPRKKSALGVIALCWLIVVFDGYDLIVYGTTIPALLEEPGWELTPGAAGRIGSLAFAGMLIGALSGGAIADRLGRRRTIIVSVLWFSVFTGLCGWASGPEVFGLLRFVGGFGLGALVPSANALTAEFVGDRWRSVVATAMMSGVPIGGSIAAVVALDAIPAFGWESLYFFGFSGLVLAVLVTALLPESPAWLRARGRHEEAARVEATYDLPAPVGDLLHVTRTSAGDVLRPPYVAATLLFFVATTATMFAWYGLGTWLPRLTQSDPRFDLGGNPLTYLLALNLGAVAVSAVTAWSATRFGALRVAVAAASVGALSLAVLTTFPSSIAVVYLLLILAGAGSHGTLCLIISAIATHYPPTLRGTALGSSLGGGRVGAVIAPAVAGWLLALNPTSATSSIVLFAAASGLGAVLLVAVHLITRPRVAPEEEPAHATETVLVH